ncbi:GerAB/ArcD/ProY family transporter [Brevibacillus nitrificans]|uniref:GerAB/ArcD/ProY family transporter n=1 Tax=Brevibacillus nitrificans TaxID=651560 RepID=UPI00262BE22C|nr:endospore germination permease [Brevibacillus nitrificans]MED1791906.1 endospore germination permease [Brevibacillus nitrificans]
MKKYAYNEVTVMQYIFLIHGTQVGIGMLTMPRDLAAQAGTDGWISIIIGWIAAVIVSLILISAMKRRPEMTIVEILQLLLGKWLGKAAVVVLTLYCVLAASTIFAYAVSLINVWLLPQTPPYIVVLLFIIPAYQVIQGGVRVLGRYSELIFYLTLWMPFVLLTTWPKMNWIHLLPLIKEGWPPILQATQSTVLSFLGFELSFFLYPFLQKKQYAAAGIVVANTLSMLVFLSITLLCFGFFSPDEITQFTWPTLGLWKVIEFRFLERVDILFLAFYLFILSTTGLPYMYFTVFSTSQLFGLQDHRGHLKIFLLVILVAGLLYTPSFSFLGKLVDLWGKVGLIFAYAFPVLLGIVMLFLRKTPEGQKV